MSARAPPCNSVDDHVNWLRSKTSYPPNQETEYRGARSSEQTRVAENLHGLYNTAGVLLVDAEGHGIISAKVASTVHDTFHAFMLSELDRWGRQHPSSLKNQSPTGTVNHRSQCLGRSEEEYSREVATMLYGEVQLSGHFRFVNFGHPHRCCSPRNWANFWISTRAGWCSSCPSD